MKNRNSPASDFKISEYIPDDNDDNDSVVDELGAASAHSSNRFMQHKQEVKKTTAKDNRRVFVCRIVCVTVLLLCALTVTVWTYSAWQQDQEDGFEQAVSQSREAFSAVLTL